MKKTDLIKKAINTRVAVQFYDDHDEYKGWLVPDSSREKHYLLLPFTEPTPGESESIWAMRVSHIKHLIYINNGYRLW